MQINPKPTLDNLGGKGYHLEFLKEICNVPEFFVIKFDASEEVDNEEVQKKILDFYKERQFGLVSVRSSATIEDGAVASFAGMFDSVLNVKEDGLIQAIREVVISAEGLRVIEYCRLKGIDYSKITMRVIVQRMIDSRISGVCFTKTPNSDNQMAIEACLGLGEALVSGRVTPDKYVVNRTTLSLEDVSISYQNTMLGKNEYVEVPFYKGSVQKATNEQIRDLSKTSLEIEKTLQFYGADIEWAIEGNTLYILQARPVTFASEIEENGTSLPSIENYQMTFKVAGLPFMFADLLCHGFGYLHPLFICSDGNFLQYFTNAKMQYAANYGHNWLSAEDGFDEYEKKFTDFHETSFAKLVKVISNELNTDNTKHFFEIIYEYFVFYSKMDFQFTNTVYLYAAENPTIAENLKKLSTFKDIARVWINNVSIDDDCCLNKLLSQISEKFGVSVDALGLYKMSEMISLFDNKKVEDKELNERASSSIVMFDGKSIRYVCADEAIKYVNEVREIEKIRAKADIIGQVANKGNDKYVAGKVRLINVDYANLSEMGKAIEEMIAGEILISEFTAPELMAACSKAKAIVTDLGGMLSHAAIISRELGIPCIVGTAHASRSLKNSDNIEIDLDTGAVKKIR
ncbi:MAG: PEP-utilizing enzyme [Oscillospiraceae bacterium]|nr:PEP-utilizing enzyme [Oscillospiraceae bacterium]